jgi:nucleotide-binding universal stress UspA family protein
MAGEKKAMYHKIIAPLDGSELAENILPHVATLAAGCPEGTVELVRVVENIDVPTRGGMAISGGQLNQLQEEARQEAEDYLNKVRQPLADRGLNVNIRVLTGKAADVLADYVRESGADLLVISSHGRSGPSRWLWGSVAEKLLHSACVPVMIIRHQSCQR